MAWNKIWRWCRNCEGTDSRHYKDGMCQRCHRQLNPKRKPGGMVATEHIPVDIRTPKEVLADATRLGSIGLLSEETRISYTGVQATS